MAGAPGGQFANRILAAILSPLGIVALYALVGSAWIFWSDHLLEVLYEKPRDITRFQTAKGLVYVVGTASLLYLGILAGQLRLRRAAEKLARAEADLRTLLREASDAILVLDGHGAVTMVNEQAARLLGQTEAAMLGRPAGDLLGPIDPARLQEAAARMEEHGAFIEEHDVRRPDGSVVRAEFHFSRLTDGRLQAIARDITERRRLEAQLLQAQKMEVVGRMASGVAHDFNNLLTIILGSAGSARDQVPEGSEVARDLDAITEAAGRGAAITRQLLSFSRKTPLASRPVDLADAVEALVPMAQRLTGRAITLDTNLTRHLPAVHLDPVLFEQAMLNLVANARDAMPGGGTITLRTLLARQRNGTPAQVEVAVSDTGQGMDPATRERVFDPFFTTKPSGKGTGLGLPMVRDFAERSGGSVAVDSAPGRGTTVRLRFPAGETQGKR